MEFEYISVIKEKNGEYMPSFTNSFESFEGRLRLAEELGHTPVYQGRMEMEAFLERGTETVMEFVEEANKTGEFDAKKLEGLLK